LLPLIFIVRPRVEGRVTLIVVTGDVMVNKIALRRALQIALNDPKPTPGKAKGVLSLTPLKPGRYT